MSNCPQCNQPLPADAPLGLCLNCLLNRVQGNQCPTSPASTVADQGSATRGGLEGIRDKLGPYQLMDCLGEGGFGIVYLAEQREPIRRRVALKIIKAGMDTRQVLARFEVERQALAMMDHPNIAKVLDAGTTETGRPYFVMELVRGVPLTTFCEEGRLDCAQRLALFAQVCSAVQHAHEQGIIHRDLKPSNILVATSGSQPIPKIIDFGIAKATQQKLTEMTIYTQFDQFLGTPAYVSPEQATVSVTDVDLRSDIYSLGAILYELLTDSPPHDPKTLQTCGYEEMRRLIHEEDPAPPSKFVGRLEPAEAEQVASLRQTTPRKLVGFLRGSCDWVVLKALEKSRERRYASAQEFLEDIERLQRGEQVSASSPRFGRTTRRILSRNRTSLGIGLGVFLALASLVTMLLINSRPNVGPYGLPLPDPTKTLLALQGKIDGGLVYPPTINRADIASAREWRLLCTFAHPVPKREPSDKSTPTVPIPDAIRAQFERDGVKEALTHERDARIVFAAFYTPQFVNEKMRMLNHKMVGPVLAEASRALAEIHGEADESVCAMILEAKGHRTSGTIEMWLSWEHAK